MTSEEARQILINSELGHRGEPWEFDHGDGDIEMWVAKFVDAYPYMGGEKHFYFFRFAYPVDSAPSLDSMWGWFVDKKTGEIIAAGTAPVGIPLYRRHPEWDWDAILKAAGE